MTQKNSPNAAWDYQAKAVYAWERDFIERAVGPQIMSRDQCENLIRTASAYLRMRAPAIRYVAYEDHPCFAVPDLHELHIASWGRGHVTLLHEIAHLDSWPSVVHGEAPHGPTFVGCAMGLYARFIGVSFDRLEETARLRGIDYIPPMRPALAVPRDDRA